MITSADNYAASVRRVRGRVRLYNNSGYVTQYSDSNLLKSIDIERIGLNKFFGFGICQRLNTHLIDKDRVLEITTDNYLIPDFYIEEIVNIFPKFYVSEVHRNENTNELSITAYDVIYNADKYTVNDLDLPAPFTLYDIVSAIATIIGANGVGALGFPVAELYTNKFSEEVNFDGTETLRNVLDAAAEATQTVYYIHPSNVLVFKRLDRDGEAVLDFTKDIYFTLNAGTNRRLATITHATELGDNLTVTTGYSGSTQFVRSNPFWELQENIATYMQNAIDAVGGLTINQFECHWRGNPLLEIGDKISLTAKDGSKVTSYVLDDVISYDGTLSQVTKWEYEDNEEETESNPTTLGEALKQTYARVDKANKQIELVASKVDSNEQAISAILVDTGSITATVERIEQATEAALGGLNDNVAELTSKVEASITSEDVNLQISTALANGVDKVITTTGFTFNEEGLTVTKSGSEMTTAITEDGMRVYRDSEEVLIADNEGVKAEDLHATTYLIIGRNSRFEDYGDNRTGCFWIGGF